LTVVTIKEWFTIEEAAEYLRVSKRTIYKLTADGRLPAFHIGLERHRRFRQEDLDRVPRPAVRNLPPERQGYITATSDPVLAAIWDNDLDSAYDRI
jgi:excisionase family DNA binding protein